MNFQNAYYGHMTQVQPNFHVAVVYILVIWIKSFHNVFSRFIDVGNMDKLRSSAQCFSKGDRSQMLVFNWQLPSFSVCLNCLPQIAFQMVNC